MTVINGCYYKDDGAPLERLRKGSNDYGKFHNIGRKCQVKVLIIRIPAWKEYQHRSDNPKSMRTMITDKEERQQKHDSWLCRPPVEAFR